MPLDDLTPNPELMSALRAERDRLDQLMDSLREARHKLEEDLRAMSTRIEVVIERRLQLARFLGEDFSDRNEAAGRRAGRARAENRRDGRLRGAAIREAAVSAALADDQPERSRHYREWLALIEATGQKIDGRDPAATLLTQLSRCPLIIRALEPGTYRLDGEALFRLRKQRDALRAEADDRVTSTNDRDYDVIDLAQALAAVEASVRRIDRTIAEAMKLVDRLDARWFFVDPVEPEPHEASARAVAA